MKWLHAAAVAALVLIGGHKPALAELRNITIGTNPSGSSYYLIGSGFAKAFQEELGIRSTAQPFAGSSVYLPSISIGDITMGLSSTIDSGLAYNGEANYPQPISSLRGIARVWNIPYAFIARADSGIVTVDDLKGKRVMANMPASQALTRINEAIVRSGGLEPADTVYMSSGGLMDGITAVVEGRADAAPVSLTMPALIEAHSSTPGGLRVVGNGSKGDAAFFAGQVQGVTTGVAQPDNRRPFIVGETAITSYDTLLVVNETMSDDDAYVIAKTLYDNWAELQKNIGPLRVIAQDQLALADPSVPYHPGAVRFFKEVGLWTERNQANQDKF